MEIPRSLVDSLYKSTYETVIWFYSVVKHTELLNKQLISYSFDAPVMPRDLDSRG